MNNNYFTFERGDDTITTSHTFSYGTDTHGVWSVVNAQGNVYVRTDNHEYIERNIKESEEKLAQLTGVAKIVETAVIERLKKILKELDNVPRD